MTTEFEELKHCYQLDLFGATCESCTHQQRFQWAGIPDIDVEQSSQNKLERSESNNYMFNQRYSIEVIQRRHPEQSYLLNSGSMIIRAAFRGRVCTPTFFARANLNGIGGNRHQTMRSLRLINLTLCKISIISVVAVITMGLQLTLPFLRKTTRTHIYLVVVPGVQLVGCVCEVWVGCFKLAQPFGSHLLAVAACRQPDAREVGAGAEVLRDRDSVVQVQHACGINE